MDACDFCYAAVLRKDIPLAQHCPNSGNFDVFFQKYSEKNSPPIGRTIVISDGFLWGIQVEPDGLTFLCVIKQKSDQGLLDKALDDIKSRFLRSHGGDWRKIGPFGLQTSFEPQLILVKQSLLSLSGAFSKDTATSDKIDDELLQDSIEDKLMNRIRSDYDPTLTDNSFKMEIEPTNLNAKSKAKDILVISGMLLAAAVIVYLVLSLICGGFSLKPRCLD